jgi:pantothenate kinase type III
MVTFLLQAISHQMGGEPRVVLTGGLSAHAWAAAIPLVHAIDPHLTLRGLALLHAELATRESVASRESVAQT